MADNTTETIRIVLEGENQSAVKSINEVVSALKTIKEAYLTASKKVDTTTANLKKLNDAVKGFSAAGANKLTQLADAMSKLKENSKVDFGKSAERLTKFANAASALSGFNFDKLRELADILQDFRGLPDIRIPRMGGQSSYKKSKAEQTAVDRGTTTKAARTGEDAEKAAERASGAFARLKTALASAKSELADFGKSLGQATSIIGKDLVGQATSWALGGSSALSALYAAQPELAVILGLVTKLAGVLAAVGEAVWNVTRAVLTFPFKIIGNAISKIYSAVSNLVKMAKKRILYRLLNSLISAVQKGFSEGIKNVYEWSKAIGGEAAKSLDKIATAGLYFKNSIGAMVSPIINALAPAIDYLVDKCVELINVLNQVFAVLTGAGTWTKALKYPTEYEDASKKATKAAKELKKSVLGIDELNQLTDNSNRGGSGSGDALDYSKMFETETVTSKIAEFFKKVKEEFQKGNFEEVGTMLGEKLNDVVGAIDNWITTNGPEVTTKIENFAKIFNKFGDSVNWEAIGATIGNGFNTALDWMWTTITKFDWVGTAKHLANTLNGFVKKADWAKIGKTISAFMDNSLDWLITAVKTFDWKGLGTKLGEMFDNIDWEGIKQKLGTLFQAAFSAGMDLLKEFLASSGLDHILRPIWNTFIMGLAGFISVALPGVGPYVSAWVMSFLSYGEDAAEEGGEAQGKTYIAGVGEVLQNPEPEKKTTFKEIFDRMIHGNSYDAGKTEGDSAIAGMSDSIKKPGNVASYSQVLDNMLSGNAYDAGKSAGDSFLKGLTKAVKEGKLPTLKYDFTYSIGTGGKVNDLRAIPTVYAQGGFPDVGEMFVAREAGPELVGSIGGRTAVMNNDQIVESVSQGVYEANAEQNSLLREQNQLLRAILAKDEGGHMTAPEILATLGAWNRRVGQTATA